MRNTSAQDRNNSPVMKVAIAAEINAVTKGFDYSYGATNWDGAEQSLYPTSNRNARDGSFIIHMNVWGWEISDAHYAKWKKNVGTKFQAPQRREATISPNIGKIRAHSRAVYGKTIFWLVK